VRKGNVLKSFFFLSFSSSSSFTSFPLTAEYVFEKRSVWRKNDKAFQRANLMHYEFFLEVLFSFIVFEYRSISCYAKYTRLIFYILVC
jgi:hypothetical protein